MQFLSPTKLAPLPEFQESLKWKQRTPFDALCHGHPSWQGICLGTEVLHPSRCSRLRMTALTAGAKSENGLSGSCGVVERGSRAATGRKATQKSARQPGLPIIADPAGEVWDSSCVAEETTLILWPCMLTLSGEFVQIACALKASPKRPPPRPCTAAFIAYNAMSAAAKRGSIAWPSLG